jgi:DNA modification methylase
MSGYRIVCGDCLDVLRGMDGESVHCCVTSPPYWGLRDYKTVGQIGLERTPEEYVGRLVEVFREVRRVLRTDGTLWLNLGDSYNSRYLAGAFTSQGRRNKQIKSLKPKNLVGIPWRVAFALQADGWYLRSDIIWAKPSPMPESVADRPTKAHEYVFLLSRAEKYYYDAEAIMEPAISGDTRKPYAPGQVDGRGNGHDRGGGKIRPSVARDAFRSIKDWRNRRSVWTIATKPYPEAHFATFPEALVEPCIKAGCPVGGTVLDPFVGSGTTLLVARRLGCESIGIELNPAYVDLAHARMRQDVLDLVGTSM